MIKKLTMLAMAVAAVAALVAPAAASAAPQLTMPAETKVPVGTAISLKADKGTLHEIITETELGTLECEHINLHGEVTKNTGTEFAGETIVENPTGSWTSGCFLEPGHHPVEIHKISSTFKSTGANEGSVGFTFLATIQLSSGVISCHFYTGTTTTTPPAVPATTAAFSWVSGTSTATIAPVELEGGPCGEATLEGSVTVETTAGGAIIID